MHLSFQFVGGILVAGLALVAHPSCLSSQQPVEGLSVSSGDLPEAPQPQIEIARGERVDQLGPGQPASGGEDQQAQPPGTVPDPTQEDKERKAEEQIKQQEHQRVLGFIPSFNTSYVSDAVSLSPKQKASLAFHSAVDPYTFAMAFIVAGLGEAKDDDPGFGWGPEGYFKRSGAHYLDAFDGTMFGNAFLPIVLHQDPRYFRLGHGTVTHRLLYAVATSVICKHDNTGKWEPNYSNVGGNLIAGALSNFYYPSAGKSSVAQTFNAGFTVIVEGTLGATLQEFWPDVSRKVFHKDPTNGLDAQARAADEAKKKAKLNQR